MKLRGRWRFTAQVPADQYFVGATLSLWFHEAVTVAILGAMAYWDLPLKWIVVAAAIFMLHTLGGFVLDGMRRMEGMRPVLQGRVASD